MYEMTSELWQFYENHLKRPGGARFDMSKRKPGTYVDMGYMYKKWEEPAKRPLNECIKFLERIGRKNAANYFKDKIDECKQLGLLLNEPLRECVSYMYTGVFPSEDFKKDCLGILVSDDPAAYLVQCYEKRCYGSRTHPGANYPDAYLTECSSSTVTRDKLEV